MKFNKNFLILFFSFSLFSVSFLSTTPRSVFAQDTKIALQRGYRTGYSDGYMSGYRDSIENSVKNPATHGEYAKADRAYQQNYGTLEDYRDGYQQGFESGYETGFDKRAFEAALPNGLNKRGVIAVTTETASPIVEEKPAETTVAETTTPVATEPTATTTTPVVETPAATVEKTAETTTATVEQPAYTSAPPPVTITRTAYDPKFENGDTAITIPTDTELIVEVLSDIDTEKSAAGDKFQARIISPNELDGAIIEGRISKIVKPGRIKRRSEVLLSFDRIVLSERRWSNFNAIVTEVLPRKGDNIKRVDLEGTVEGKSSIKSDSIKVGASTGTGLVVGAIAGGPVGAAVGAGVGAAFGVGAVVVERGKHIRINKDQQVRIKTVYETQIR